MPAGTTTPAGAGTTVTAARSPSDTARLVAGAEDRLFPLDLFTAALLALDGRILLAHGADCFELLLARLADIFVDGHEIHLVTGILGNSTPKFIPFFLPFGVENIPCSCYY